MTSEEDRVRHYERRKRNEAARALRENKAVQLKIIPPADKYKRVKLKPHEINTEDEDE